MQDVEDVKICDYYLDSVGNKVENYRLITHFYQKRCIMIIQRLIIS